ncbi:hypothetical protein AB6A23_12605 [Paenibacillus tarimensis]
MKVKIIVLLMILIGIFSIWYLTPKRYTETLDGVYFQLGKEGIIEHIKIHFDGKLKNHINGKKSFKGAIDFEGNEVPRIPEDRTELELHYNGENFSTIFSAFRIKDDRGKIEPDSYTFGWIYINDDFTQFTIKVFTIDDSGSWSHSDGLMITAPAKDREEALKKSEELIRGFELQ